MNKTPTELASMSSREFRDHLVGLLEEMMSQNESGDASDREFSNAGVNDEVDRAALGANREMAAGLRRMKGTNRAECLGAIDRIRHHPKEFEFCQSGESENCNGKISRPRLQAYPTTTHCIHCAEEEQKKDLSHGKNRIAHSPIKIGMLKT